MCVCLYIRDFKVFTIKAFKKPLSYLIQSGPDCKQHFDQLVSVPGLHRSQLLMFTNRFARCFSEPGSGHSLWRESDFIKESKLTLRFGVLSNFLTICNIASTWLEILCQAATVSNIVVYAWRFCVKQRRDHPLLALNFTQVAAIFKVLDRFEMSPSIILLDKIGHCRDLAFFPIQTILTINLYHIKVMILYV